MLTIALSKGRLHEETLPLLRAAGIVPAEDPEVSRKLILPTSREGVRVIIVRASDVPTYVQYGAADLGVAGRDLLIVGRIAANKLTALAALQEVRYVVAMPPPPPRSPAAAANSRDHAHATPAAAPTGPPRRAPKP